MADRPLVVLAMRPALLPDVLGPALLARLRAVADVDTDHIVTRGDDDRLAAATVLLTSWGAPRVDATVLDRAPRLTAVVHAAGSVKELLAEEVWRRGIGVSSAARANAVPVVEYTVAAVLLAGKRAFRLAHDYRGGTFPGQVDGEDSGNHGRTIGIVGASHIGRLVLAALARHDFQLLLADPYVDQATATTLGARLVDLDTLCATSDVVSLHAPSLPETRHLLDDRRLSLIRDGGVVINTARGALIDTDALTRHCTTGGSLRIGAGSTGGSLRIGAGSTGGSLRIGAGSTGRLDAVLDVTDPEPLPADHPLLHTRHVLVTPHVAGARGNEIARLGAHAVADVERHLRGEPMRGAVAFDQLARLA